MKFKFIISAVLAGLCSIANAQESGDMDVGLGFSSLGPALQGRYVFSENIAIRGIVSTGLSRSMNQTEDGIEYNFKGNIGGVAILGDYQIMGGNFLVSGGLLSSRVGIDLSANLANQDFGDQIGVTGKVSGKAEFKNKTSPLVSVGYKRNLTDSFIIRGDLGAIMTGGFVLSASTDIAQVTQADIDKELAKTRDDLSKLTVYPFISITASYTF
jgi:hypothetical protein